MRTTLIPTMDNIDPSDTTGKPLPGVEWFMGLPFPGEATVSADYSSFSWYPLRADEDFWVMMWHQVRQISFAYSMHFPDFSLTVSGDETLVVDPLVGPDDETSRESAEDNYRWYRLFQFGTFPNEIEFVVELMPPDPNITPEPRYYYREDDYSIIPRLKITMILSYNDGPEFRLEMNTGEQPAVIDRGPNYFTTTILYYGQEISVWVEPEIVCDSFSLIIGAPTSGGYWEYRDANGENPITNGDTNTQLLRQWPTYGPNAPIV